MGGSTAGMGFEGNDSFDFHFNEAKLLYLNCVQRTQSSCSASKNELHLVWLVSLGKFHAESIGQPHPGPEFSQKHQGLVSSEAIHANAKHKASGFNLRFPSTKAWTWTYG